MKTGILLINDVLHSEGAENLAVNIAVNLKNSKEYNPIFYLTRKGGILEEVLHKHDIKYYIAGRKSALEIYKFYSLKRIIKENNIKLLHAHKQGSNFWGSVFGKIFGIPSISHFHAHNAQVGNFKNYLYGTIIGKLSDKIISISEYESKRLIKEEGIPSSKIVTIYNGLNYTNYMSAPNSELKEELGIQPESPIVGIVAAFRPQKNHRYFINIAQEILRTNNNVIFLLVGEGILKQEIQALARESGIHQNCIFTGSRRDIPDIMSIIDIGVLTSHWEGLPLVGLEYMASSKPVVFTNVSGLSELVNNGINGYLVPEGQVTEFAGKVTHLIENTELAHNMGQNGLSIVKHKFSEQAMMDNIIDIYDEILRNI